MAAGLIGAALFYGDGVITPAISVLSAVEGLKVATPIFDPYVVPISLALLTGLFLVQRHGTAAIGGLFGPIMLLWFAVLALLGLWNVAQHPAVLWALDPWHGIALLASAPWQGFVMLGAVFLAVTGAETLVRRYGPFRPHPAAHRVALSRPAGAAAELLRAGRAAAARRRRAGKPVLSARPELGSLSAGRPRLHGDDHRLASGHLRRVFDHAPGHSTRLSAAAAGAAHLGAGDRAGLCAENQYRTVCCHCRPGDRLSDLRQSRRRLRHRGDRHDGHHQQSRFHLYAQHRLEPRSCGCRVRFLPGHRSHFPQRQSAEDRARRLVPDAGRGACFRGHVDLVARPPACSPKSAHARRCRSKPLSRR